MALVPILMAGLLPLIVLPVMLTMSVALPAMPYVPAAPAALELPPRARIPAPLGKLEMVLPLMVAAVTLATVVAEPKAIRRMPEPFEVAVELVLVMMLFEMLALVSVPSKLETSMP